MKIIQKLHYKKYINESARKAMLITRNTDIPEYKLNMLNKKKKLVSFLG